MLRKITIAFLAGGAILAQELDRPAEADRIRSVIAEVNKAVSRSDAASLSRLFTVDGRAAIVRAIEKQRSDWSEVTPAFIEIQSVQFVSPELALVNATQTQYGSVILKRSVPVMLLMKLESKEWRIHAIRIKP